MIYLGIDVGIVNLACVKLQVNDENLTMTKIISAFCINLSEIQHQKISKENCQLKHSNDVYDKIQHFLQEYQDVLSDVDQVRIERQPIGGLVHVEQLLFGHFRSCAKLISPNSMHKFLGIGHLDYEQRKEKTILIASPYLKNFQDWKTRDRLHDMADAFCILLFSLYIDRKEKFKKEEKEQMMKQQIVFQEQQTSVENFFNQFIRKSEINK
jgi:hypothetical protein